MSEVELTGTNPITYPELATWEWPVPAYLFIGGLVAGLMILTGVFRLRKMDRFATAVRIADLWALPLLGIGLLLLWLDLSNKLNAWRFFTTFQVTSPMSWGSWILLLTGIVLALRLAAGMAALPDRPVPGWARRPWGWARSLGDRVTPRLPVVDAVGIALGIGLGLYTGVLLSTITARPLWDSVWLAPLFLVSGMAAGGAFLCLFLEHDAHLRLAPLSMALCGVELGLIGLYLWSLLSGAAPQQAAGELIVGGAYTWWFWIPIVGLGLLVPLGIEIAEQRGRRLSQAVGMAAPILKLGGSATLRFVIVLVGLQTVL